MYSKQKTRGHGEAIGRSSGFPAEHCLCTEQYLKNRMAFWTQASGHMPQVWADGRKYSGSNALELEQRGADLTHKRDDAHKGWGHVARAGHGCSAQAHLGVPWPHLVCTGTMRCVPTRVHMSIARVYEHTMAGRRKHMYETHMHTHTQTTRT